MQPSAYTDDVLHDLAILIKDTSPEQMADRTPCTKWTVHDLINHVVFGGHMMAAAFRGEPIPGIPNAATEAEVVAATPDLLGENPASAFEDAIADYREAISRPGAADRIVTLPFAELPGQVAMDIAAVDLLVHSWDLARATGRAFSPSPELVDAADAFARSFITPEARDGDSFAAEILVPADASPLDRLIAFTGRQP